jgi:cyclophilin family peptidyl-prolyl cis-trans isomerase
MNPRFSALLLVGTAVVLGSGPVVGQSAITPTPAATAPAGYSVMPYTGDQASYSFSVPGLVLAPNTDYLAIIETDAGRMVVDLFEDKTPFTINSFVWLANNRYYNGIAFHRVLEDFMAQTGDPNSLRPQTNTNLWGTGGPGYLYGLEVRTDLKFDKKGVLGMARSSQPASNGSQFFITFKDTSFLNNQYTVFGQVIEGLDVLDKIIRVDPQNLKPNQSYTRMNRVYIASKPK